MGRDQILTTLDVERLLFQGHKIVIKDGLVLQLDNLIKNHPGGSRAVEHMVGRDASNEINV